MTIGVLALQGDFAAHSALLQSLGHSTRLVRRPEELEEIGGLVIPGGESTVLCRLCDRFGFWEPLAALGEAHLPLLGTCAGLIFLASEITNGAATFPQRTLQLLDVTVERNSYGPQVASFEADVEVPVLQDAVRGVFIRAPLITRVGPRVEVLAHYGGSPVLVHQENVMACSFHPEIAGETRIHSLWLSQFAGASGKAASGPPG